VVGNLGRLMSSSLKRMKSCHGKQIPRLMTAMANSTHPCLKCSDPLRYDGLTESQFRAKLDDKFNGKYEIELFDYIGNETRVNLNCSIDGHSGFSIQASSLHKSRGCLKCGAEQAQLNRNQGL
jgi:hypothetical protein